MSDEQENKLKVLYETVGSQALKIEALEKKFEERGWLDWQGICEAVNRHCGEIAGLRAIEKVTLDTIEVISKDYKNIKEVLREDYQFKIKNLPDSTLKKHYEGLLEKLDSKMELCKECLYKNNFDDNTCGACKPNSPQSRFRPKEASEQTEKIPIGDDLMKRIMSHKSVPMDKSKYKTEKKENKCEGCGRREIRCELDVEFRRMCLKSNRNCFKPKDSGGEKERLINKKNLGGAGQTPAVQTNSKLPEHICTLKEQEDCEQEFSMECLKRNSEGYATMRAVCVHGKKELEKLPELILNDPCQPCESDVGCDECSHAHPELDICKCQHERNNHKKGIEECWCGCKSFKVDTFSGIPKEKEAEPKKDWKERLE